MLKWFLLFFFMVILMTRAKDEHDQDHDDDVINYLLNITNYKKQVRPTKQVTLDLIFSYGRLAQLDEKSGTLSSSFYIQTKWSDFRLKWNQSTFNLQEVLIPAKTIWHPDLAVINSVLLEYAILSFE